MKKRLYSFLLVSFLTLMGIGSSVLHAQNYPQLSEDSKISLMTCGPGAESYSMFGHSALWVFDPIKKIDRIYNYGTFNFEDSHFYYKFTRGIADYMLSLANSASFVREYTIDNRTVEQQILNLTQNEKQKLFKALEENYKPENRFYRYDFLFLNCSSIIRDRVFDVIDDRYALDTTDYGQSFRDLLQPYINNSWIKLGINLLLGVKADKQADNWDRMFLPDHMRDQFTLAHSADNSLAQPVKKIFLGTQAPVTYNKTNNIDTPFIVFIILLVFTGILTRKKFALSKWNKPLDSFIFLITGAIGILLTFLWFFSEHEVIHQNINVLWAFPLHILIPIIIWIPSLSKIVAIYSKILFSAIALFMALAILGVQEIPSSLLVLSGIVMLRLFRYAFFMRVPNQIEGQKAN